MRSSLCPIEFTAALCELQGMIGEEVLVTLDFGRRFFGGSFHSRLERVETLPPDYCAVVLRFEHEEAIQLDPAELEACLLGRTAGAPAWLEFRVILGPALRVEPATISAAGWG